MQYFSTLAITLILLICSKAGITVQGGACDCPDTKKTQKQARFLSDHWRESWIYYEEGHLAALLNITVLDFVQKNKRTVTSAAKTFYNFEKLDEGPNPQIMIDESSHESCSDDECEDSKEVNSSDKDDEQEPSQNVSQRLLPLQPRQSCHQNTPASSSLENTKPSSIGHLQPLAGKDHSSVRLQHSSPSLKERELSGPKLTEEQEAELNKYDFDQTACCTIS